METSEISLHQLKVFLTVRDAGRWVTNKEIAVASGVALRTASLHTLRFVNLGIFDQAEVFPAHHYKLSELADKRNKAMFERLEKAREVFGF